MTTTIKLANGNPIVVRRLGIFELDNLVPDPVGIFTYKIKALTGSEFDVEFDISSYEEPPQKPTIPENQIEENSTEWFALLDWQLYEGAKLHDQKRAEAVSNFHEKVAQYVLDHCLENDDKNNITCEEDWEAVFNAALVPQLTVELLADTLNKTYGAKFLEEDIFTALEKTEKGHGSYNTIRLWENKLMISMRMSEIEYAMLPLEERARKICAIFLEPVMSSLETDYSMKKDKKVVV